MEARVTGGEDVVDGLKGWRWRGGRNPQLLGVLVKEEWEDRITVREDLGGERMVWLEVRGEEKLFLGFVYGPQEQCPQAERDAFYEPLAEVVETLRGEGEVAVAGDFNAWMREETEEGVVLGNREERTNGKRLSELALVHGLVNATFARGLARLPDHRTWERGDEGGDISIVDYVFLSQGAMGRMGALERVDRGMLSSDHWGWMWEMRMGEEVGRNSGAGGENPGGRPGNWDVRLLDVDAYREALEKEVIEMEVAELEGDPDAFTGSADEMLAQFMGLVEGALEDAGAVWRSGGGGSGRPKRDKAMHSLQQRLRRARQQSRKEKVASLRAKIRSLSKRRRKEAWRDRQEYMVSRVERAPLEFWRWVRALGKGGRRTPLPTHMQGPEGEAEAGEVFREFFSSAFAGEEGSQGTDGGAAGVGGGFEMEEFELAGAVLRSFRRVTADTRKGAGPDAVSPLVLKRGGLPMVKLLTLLFSCILRTGCIPKAWREAELVPLYKGGTKDPGAPTSYRPVALTSVVGKVLEGVLAEQILQAVRGQLDDAQYGFLPQRGTRDAVWALLEVLRRRHGPFGRKRKGRGRGSGGGEEADGGAQGEKRAGGPTYCLFVDLTAAFDRVPLPRLFEAMERLGTPPHLVSLVRAWYGGYEGWVRVNGVRTESFEFGVGVRQGSRLSPLLFVIFLDSLFRKLRAEGLGVSVRLQDGEEVWMGALGYADDLTLLARSREEAARMMAVVEAWCEENGMAISQGKCEALVVGGDPFCGWLGSTLKDGWRIAVKRRVVYLGVALEVKEGRERNTLTMQTEGHWARRAGEAKAAATSLSQTFRKRLRLGVHLLHRLAQVRVFSTLLYGADALPVNKTQGARLDQAAYQVGREILDQRRSTASDGVFGELGWTLPSHTVAHRKLSFLGSLLLQEGGAGRMARDVAEGAGLWPLSGWWADVRQALESLWGKEAQMATHMATLRATAKEELKAAMEGWDVREWRRRVEGKSSLSVLARLKKDERREMDEWLKSASPSRPTTTKLTLRNGTSRLRGRHFGPPPGGTVRCKLCPICCLAEQDEAHYLVGCPALTANDADVWREYVAGWSALEADMLGHSRDSALVWEGLRRLREQGDAEEALDVLLGDVGVRCGGGVVDAWMERRLRRFLQQQMDCWHRWEYTGVFLGCGEEVLASGSVGDGSGGAGPGGGGAGILSGGFVSTQS